MELSMPQCEYSTKLETLAQLRQRKTALLHEKKLMALRLKLSRIESLRNKLNSSIESIMLSTNIIVSNTDKMESMIASEKSFVPMAATSAKHLCEIVATIKELYSQEGTFHICFNGLNVEEYKGLTWALHVLKNSAELIQSSITLMANIQSLNEDDVFTNKNSMKVISSSAKGKSEGSITSESSFLKTFHANNVKASSPIFSKVESESLNKN